MLQSKIIRNPDDISQDIRDFFHSCSPAFFQSTHFLTLLYGLKGFKPFMILIYRNKKIIATLAGANIREGNGIKARVSERTVIYGHPLIDSAENTALITDSLLKTLTQVTKSSLFTQFRNDTDQEHVKSAFTTAGYRWLDRLNLIKPVDNIEEAWAGLSASRRRQVNNSIRNGAVIIENPDDIQLIAFYNQLSDLYRHKVRKPLPAKEFFLRFNTLSRTGTFNGKVLLCVHNDRIIGGILCPFTPRGSIYEWYVCGLDEEYQSRKIYPSVLLTWAAMKSGYELGCRDFDFMGLGVPSKQYGVRDFKARFGGQWVNFGRWSRINNPLLYSMAELGYNALRLVRKV